MTNPTQASPSLSNISDEVSDISSTTGKSIGEGDLVTGIIDIANMRTYMVPPVNNWDRAKGKNDVENHILSLQVIPQEYRDEWTLNHPSNSAWLSAALHHHYHRYATILIAPSLNSSTHIINALVQDNMHRKEVIESGKPDPGRSETADWFEGADDKYEFIILRHSHFLIGGCPLAVRHPTTGRITFFYASKDGFLHKGGPTGSRLPPFSSRGAVERSVPLNPILVNFSAHIRSRRLERLIPEWRRGLAPDANLILQGVLDLYDAVYWKPGVPIKVPDTSSRSKKSFITTEYAMNLIEEAQNFLEIPDLRH